MTDSEILKIQQVLKEAFEYLNGEEGRRELDASIRHRQVTFGTPLIKYDVLKFYRMMIELLSGDRCLTLDQATALKHVLDSSETRQVQFIYETDTKLYKTFISVYNGKWRLTHCDESSLARPLSHASDKAWINNYPISFKAY